MVKAARKALLGIVLLALSGCGGSDATVLVEGTVSYQEEPIATGAIQFIPEAGNVQTTGGVIKDGKYRVRVFRGPMKVRITAPKVIGKTKLYDTPDSPERSVTAESLPAKYNEMTELRLDVQGSSMHKDWDLTK
jgi:hypothetical protein